MGRRGVCYNARYIILRYNMLRYNMLSYFATICCAKIWYATICCATIFCATIWCATIWASATMLDISSVHKYRPNSQQRAFNRIWYLRASKSSINQFKSVSTYTLFLAFYNHSTKSHNNCLGHWCHHFCHHNLQSNCDDDPDNCDNLHYQNLPEDNNDNDDDHKDDDN